MFLVNVSRLQRPARRRIPENSSVHRHRGENLGSYRSVTMVDDADILAKLLFWLVPMECCRVAADCWFTSLVCLEKQHSASKIEDLADVHTNGPSDSPRPGTHRN
jgi:hypothetical protein